MPKETKTPWTIRLPAESEIYLNAKRLRLGIGKPVNMREGDVVVAIVRFKTRRKQ